MKNDTILQFKICKLKFTNECVALGGESGIGSGKLITVPSLSNYEINGVHKNSERLKLEFLFKKQEAIIIKNDSIFNLLRSDSIKNSTNIPK